MSETMQREVLIRLDALTERLGEAAGWSWGVLVRQEYWVNGWMLLGIVVAAFLGAVFFGRIAARTVRQVATEYVDDLPRIALFFASAVATVILSLAVLVNTASAVAHILNPEYYALRDILRLVSK